MSAQPSASPRNYAPNPLLRLDGLTDRVGYSFGIGAGQGDVLTVHNAGKVFKALFRPIPGVNDECIDITCPDLAADFLSINISLFPVCASV